MKVAVIGAGAAGLVCARELRREKHEVCVFEQSNRIGGVWVYEPQIEDDLLGIDPGQPVFSSLYDSLRTNLPRDLMAFSDFTFDSRGGGDDFWQRYPHHSKVLTYLQNFADRFDIGPMIRFGQKILAVRPHGERWLLTMSTGQQETFDAVAVCNGHYTRPRVPELDGMASFEGRLIHSHNYRNARDFAGKRIAILGTAASGMDISREVSSHASQVFWCGDIFSLPARNTRGGVSLYPRPRRFINGKDLEFTGGERITDIDVLIFCTGYEYRFPFIDDEIITINNNTVHPLYYDMLPPAHPRLVFIGIPFLVIPFPLFEMQAKWFARLLGGDVELPAEAAMNRRIRNRQEEMRQYNIKRHHFHKLGPGQTAYMNNLAHECGESPVPAWFVSLARESQRSRLADPAHFRDKEMRFRGPTVVKIRP